jgi:hypothetical protein
MSNLLSSVLPARSTEEYDAVFLAVDRIAKRILSPAVVNEPPSEDVPF